MHSLVKYHARLLPRVGSRRYIPQYDVASILTITQSTRQLLVNHSCHHHLLSSSSITSFAQQQQCRHYRSTLAKTEDDSHYNLEEETKNELENEDEYAYEQQTRPVGEQEEEKEEYLNEFQKANLCANEGRVKECLENLDIIQHKYLNEVEKRDAHAFRCLSQLARKSRNLSVEDYVEMVQFASHYHFLTNNIELTKTFLIATFHMEKKDITHICERILHAIEPQFTCNGRDIDAKVILLPVIDCFVSGGNHVISSYLFEKLLTYAPDMKPDEINVIINHSIKKSLFAFTDQLVKYAKEKNVELSKEQLQYRLSAYLSVPHLDRAMKCFRMIMRNGDVPLDVPVYIVLLETLKKYSKTSRGYHGYMRDILRHLEAVNKLEGIDERFFRALLSNLAEMNNNDVIEHWKTKLLDLQKHLDVSTINILIKALCNTGKIQEGLEMVENMEERYRVAPDIVSFNTLLANCSSDEQQRSVLAEMDKRKISKTIDTYNIRLRYLCNQRRRDEAMSIYQKLKSRGEEHPSTSLDNPNASSHSTISPDAITITTLVRAFKDKPHVVDRLYGDCQMFNIVPDRLLVIELVRYSKEYRNVVKTQLLDPEMATVCIQANSKFPELYSELVLTLRAQGDIDLKQVQNRMFELNLDVKQRASGEEFFINRKKRPFLVARNKQPTDDRKDRTPASQEKALEEQPAAHIRPKYNQVVDTLYVGK